MTSGNSISSFQQPDEIIRELANVKTNQSLFDFIEEDDDFAYTKPGVVAKLTAQSNYKAIDDDELQERIRRLPDNHKYCVLHVARAEFAYAVPKADVNCRRICIRRSPKSWPFLRW
jgi:hypothetical protein